MRFLLLLAALPLLLLPGTVRARDADDAGLRAAVRRFPPLVLGPGVRPADGSGPHARSCPAPGGRVEQRGGPSVSYDGADPGNPDLCRMRFNGQQADGWFGIWLTFWPGAPQARAVMGRIIRGRTGDTEGFVVRMTADRTYYDVLRNEGLEDIRLLGQTFHTVKVSHYREGAPPNTYRSVVTGWKDTDTGMVVYVTYQHISGAPETGTPLDPTLIVPPP